MTGRAGGLRRLDNLIWASIALVTAFVVTAAVFGHFTIVLKSYGAPAGTSLLLMLGAAYYRNWRNDRNLAATLESTAQLMVFAAVAAPLSYVAASASRPLQDAALDNLDRALGFDWRGFLAILRDHPALFKVMHLIYLSLSLQMVAAVLILGFTGRLLWLRTYMLAFIIAAVVTITISALLPAEGVWLYYGIKGDLASLPLSHTNWPAHFAGLRDGSFRLLTGAGSEGIITFPSLHAALAIILAAAFWQVPIARWFGVVVNGLLLVSTPIDGSHYFIDVLAGIGVALASMAAARALVRLGHERTTAEPLPLAPAQARAR